MGPQLPSLVVPQIVIRTKLLDTHHTLCSPSFLGSYKHPDGMGPAPFLRALVALSASKSTRSQGGDTVISLAGCPAQRNLNSGFSSGGTARGVF